MPHIKVQDGLHGIRGLMAFRPESAQPLNKLVDVLLGSQDGLTPGERELIATYVSYLNDCYYCQTTHASVAEAHLNDDHEIVGQIKRDYNKANISEKLKRLLDIASLVQKSGKAVTEESIQAARKVGASDLEIHDTVLIAAAFCMFNRYVDGLGTTTHTNLDQYRARGKQVAEHGYTNANLELMKSQKQS